MVLLLGLVGLAYAEPSSCDEPVSYNLLHEQIDAAESAFASKKEEPFRQAFDQVQASVLCLTDVLTPPTAAAIHRLRGLSAFLNKGYGESELAFAAARVAYPSYRFPSTLLPDDHPIRQRYNAVDLDQTKPSSMPTPRRGFIRLDGRKDLTHDARLPVYFQRMDANGVVADAQLWEPLSATPVYKSGKTPPWLLVGSAVSLVGAGGLYAGAVVSKSKFEAAEDAGESVKRDQAFRANRTFFYSSMGLTTVGATLLTAHLTTKRF